MQKNLAQTDPKVGFVSLGCPKNLVDSERILTQLRTEGYEVVSDYDSAELVIVNTCGFIDSAVEESLQAIGEALEENGKVLVTGCLGSKEDTIREVHPGVLAITGPHQYEQVMGQVREHLPPRKTHDPHVDIIPDQGIKLTPRHYAYLKISEGCNHRCSFCIIPSFRGDLVSRPVGQVLSEAERLVKSGVKELLVVSQDTSAYGVDVKYKTDFWGGRPVKTRMTEMCREMGSMGAWVRLHYVYPYPHVDELIELMADGLIAPYLDIPFQHANREVLKNMKRPASSEKVLERIQNWRKAVPDLAIRSTFIAGFPGESEAQFQELLDFVEEAQIDRAGVFPYSPVEGATANQLPGALPDDVREERAARFSEVASRVSANRLERLRGRDVECIIDEAFDDGGIGRTIFDAPEVDGQVFFNDVTDLFPGQRLTARVLDSDEHDIWAEPA